MCAISVNPYIVDNLEIPGYNFYQKKWKKYLI